MAVNQAHLFLIFTTNGVFIGFIFDFFRILRKGFKTNNLVTYVEDIAFWVIAGLSIIYSMVNFSNGTLRVYMMMGIFIGFTIYILTISKYISMSSLFIIFFLKKIIKYTLNIILYPLKVIYKIISIPLKYIVKIIYLKTKKCFHRQKNKTIYQLPLKITKKSKKSTKKRGIFLKNVEK